MILNRFSLVAFLAVCGLILVSSCDKTNQIAPTPPKEIPTKSFYAEVDGVPFVDTVFWGEMDEGANVLQISAYADGGYPFVQLNLPGDISVGSFDLGGTGSAQSATVSIGSGPNTLFVSDASNGLSTITINEHNTDDDYIIGTFEFYALPSWDPSLSGFLVTSGEFTLNYY